MQSKRFVLVTGASTGIGRSCVAEFASAGYEVFAGVRRPRDGEDLVEAHGARVHPLLLDVTDSSHLAALSATVTRQLAQRPLVAVVNNAGIAVAGPLEQVCADALRQQFEVNVFGAMGVARELIPLLRLSRGKLIQVSSISGRIAFPMLGAYAASKFALEAMSDALRVELKSSGIDVVLIEPGPVVTPIWEKSTELHRQQQQQLGERDLYAEVQSNFQRYVEESAKSGIAATEVAALILNITQSRRPRARYLVGRGSRRRVLLSALLPTRWRDALFRRLLWGAST